MNQLGFTDTRNSAHTARTMMLNELTQLLEYVDDPESAKEDYANAIENDNCLSKRSGRTRQLTTRHLTELYSLDPAILIFRALRFFWQRDIDGRPLVALLCACARDRLLAFSAPFILKYHEGELVTREVLEDYIDKLEPGRFSPATLKSTAQNINSTWTQSGHLVGRIRKYRTKAKATPGSVAYALYLGYLSGERGTLLFQTYFMKILDCSVDKSVDFAEEASVKGWMVFKHIQDVIEVSFPLVNK